MHKQIIKGAGMGLRMPHAATILKHQPDVNWFELLVDNCLKMGSLQLEYLSAITQRYPVVIHGVGLSLGGSDALNFEYLAKIKQFKQRVSAHWYSEHCSFSQHNGAYVPDLLPLPFTQEAVVYISERIKRVQDFMGEAIVLENVSSYVECAYSHLSEAQFMAAIVQESGCKLLLDINNCFVSAYNSSDVDSGDKAALYQYVLNYFQQLPAGCVQQIHLAGHENRQEFLLDTHGAPVCNEVWDLFSMYIQQYGAVPAMIEWDNDIPDFSGMLQEYNKIEALMSQHAQGQCA